MREELGERETVRRNNMGCLTLLSNTPLSSQLDEKLCLISGTTSTAQVTTGSCENLQHLMLLRNLNQM